ncbi:DsbA family protein [Patescibacteria group bacterium]
MNKENQKSDTINIAPFIVPGAIIIAGLLIGIGIFFGKKSPIDNNPQVKASVQPANPQINVQQPNAAQVTTSIDDDAILGNKETAKVAIVEFSDYECPFCKRFRDQTFDQIIQSFVDTGQAIFVYRDLPLPFHNPAAEREANATECAREQGGDEIFYQYHDKIYETTQGNGKGISVEELVSFAGEIGLNSNEFEACVENEQYKNEITKDAADAAKVGIRGTPGFVVGKLGVDGSVNGVVISGAQPYSAFKTAIEQQLN